MSAVRSFMEAIGNAGRGLSAVFSSNKRRRYTATGLIAAPQSSVWRIASLSMMYNARDDATGTMRKAERRNDGSGIIDITVQAEGETARVAYRVVDDRPPDGQVVEILPEGQNIFTFCGRDYFLAYTLRPAGDKTELTIAHELTHTSASGYLVAPFLPYSGLRLTRRKAEDDAGTTQYHRNYAGAALVTGVLTLASFIPWLGLGGAAMLVALIFIHELGHVAAMRSVGLPVRGLYFVPFLGGVAVGAAARTEAERGFVSIMGPGLSLITTALLYWLAVSSDSSLLRTAALMSALLNGFNLLPVMPLDGGHVLDALLSRVDAGVVSLIKLCLLLVALAAALYMGATMMTVLLALALPAVMLSGDKADRIPAISLREGVALAIAYGGSLAFYAWVVRALVVPG